jgi:hypothetical protein
MSDSTSTRLPEHPSLEQLRKQAKELLRAWRAGHQDAIERARTHAPRARTPRLADAQLILSREYGFESWPKLLHHIEGGIPEGLSRFEQLARDFADAYAGDSAALKRLNDRLPGPEKDVAGLREIVQRTRQQMTNQSSESVFTLSDARALVAQKFGFGDWDGLAASLANPAAVGQDPSHGLSARSPFYHLDHRTNTLQLRQLLDDREWDVLVDIMRERRVTCLDANGQMTDHGLERLASLSDIATLKIGGSKRITDEGVRHLARMPQLEALELGGYPAGRFTDRGLEVLRHLPELKRFAMWWQSGISDAGVSHLSACDKIEVVDLMGSTVGDGAIHALRGKPRLCHLKSGRLLTDAGLDLLHELPVFKTWQNGEVSYDVMSFDASPNFLMIDGPVTNAAFERLSGLDGLFGLSIFWHASELTSDALRVLATLPRLGALGCQRELCDDRAMRHIATLPHLRMLMAQGTVATDEGFIALSRSQSIENIWGRECPNLSGRGFEALANMPSLKGLAVSCRNVDDASLASLPRFPSLTSLVPIDVTDAGFRHVGRCVQLERLTCMYCRDTGDAATEQIAGLSRLRQYYAGQTRITDRSLEILGGMMSLEDVALSACPGITNAGLVHIAKLPHLKQVSVDASAGVTRAGLAAFPPHVHVDFWI